jgi:ribonuclease HI
MEIVSVYTDGGSRGNPGLAGIGVLIKYNSEEKGYSEYIGDDRTNNEAEYEALIFALKKVKQLVGKKKARSVKVECFSDSELMVKQLNHQYKLKDEKIKKYFITIWNLMLDFNQVEVSHIPREENKKADELANEAMDGASTKQSTLSF